MDDVLIASKYTAPTIASHYFNRIALEKELLQVVHKKVILIQAPAGYGKSTLLIAALQKQSNITCWVSLDNADNDPLRFWRYVIAAISHSLLKNWDDSFLSLLQTQDPSTLQFFIHSFIEELQEIDTPIHLVFDDYHVITESIIHELMILFVEALPKKVTIYFTTRTILPLPISKWRVQGWIAEFTSEQLKFEFHETKRYLIEHQKLSLTDSQVATISSKSEGWITGIILARLAHFLEQPLEQSTHRLVSNFLWHELLYDLPKELQLFLLKTCFLPQLEATSCNQLTGRLDSDVQLDHLEKFGIFTTRIQSNTQATYRYHQLFAESLQLEASYRFPKDEYKAIIQQTTQLIYDSGNTIPAIELALQHQLFEQAETWIIKHTIELQKSGHTVTLMRWFKHFRKHDYTLQYEMLVVGFMNAVSTLEFPLANLLMEELEQRNTIERWMEKEVNYPIVNLYQRTKAYAIVALGGDIQVVKTLLNNALDSKQYPSPWDFAQVPYNFFETKLLRTGLAVKGKMHAMEESESIIQLFRNTSFHKLSVAPYIFALAAETFYERNEFAQAKRELTISMQFGERFNDLGLLVPMYLLQAKLYLLQNEVKLAQSFLAKKIVEVHDKHWYSALKTMVAHCHLFSGEFELAEEILLQVKGNQHFWTLTYARYHIKMERPNQALPYIIDVRKTAQQEEQTATLIEASVLEAICYKELGNIEYALNVLHKTFLLAAKFYYLRTFLDEAELLPLLSRYLEDEYYTSQWTADQLNYAHYFKKAMQQTPSELLKIFKRPLDPL